MNTKNYFLIFLTAIFLTACAALSPVSMERKQPAVFASINDVKPQWLPFVNGAGFFHGKIASARFEFYALMIDLIAPNIRITVKDGGAAKTALAAKAARALSAKVSSFVRDNDLIAGINAVPFDVTSSVEGQPIKNLGIVISDGELLSPVNLHYDALVFYDEYDPARETSPQGTSVRAAIVSQSSINDQSIQKIKNAVGGFYQILTDGEPAQRTRNNEQRHPRSTAGVSQDGRFLYLLVIDGRRADSAGGTEEETALLLRALGSHNGINFDGGGSSALAMRFPDGNVKVVNTPVHGMIPGQERAVAGCLGISLQ